MHNPLSCLHHGGFSRSASPRAWPFVRGGEHASKSCRTGGPETFGKAQAGQRGRAGIRRASFPSLSVYAASAVATSLGNTVCTPVLLTGRTVLFVLRQGGAVVSTCSCKNLECDRRVLPVDTRPARSLLLHQMFFLMGDVAVCFSGTFAGCVLQV